MRRYLPLLYGFVRKYCRNTELTVDITQEVFVKVWRNLRKFDQARSFKPWVFTLAKNTAIDFLREKKIIPLSNFEEKGDLDTLEFLSVEAQTNNTVKDVMLA